jgi:gas vesicle protein
MSNNKNAFCYFFIGGLIGTILGILYSPKSGKETRQHIKQLGATLLRCKINNNNIGDELKEQDHKIIQKNCKTFFEKTDRPNKDLSEDNK